MSGNRPGGIECQSDKKDEGCKAWHYLRVYNGPQLFLFAAASEPNVLPHMNDKKESITIYELGSSSLYGYCQNLTKRT